MVQEPIYANASDKWSVSYAALSKMTRTYARPVDLSAAEGEPNDTGPEAPACHNKHKQHNALVHDETLNINISRAFIYCYLHINKVLR